MKVTGHWHCDLWFILLGIPAAIPARANVSVYEMADWQPESFAPPTQSSLGSGEGSRPGGGGSGSGGGSSHRALQHTSGNVQSYAEGTMHGDGGSRDDSLHMPTKYPPPGIPFQHSISSTSLHDSHALAARWQAKKLRRLQSAAHSLPTMRPKRSYLKSQKYLDYRSRPRRDTGKDGEPVWSDALEDAFQQGERHSLHRYLVYTLLIDTFLNE